MRGPFALISKNTAYTRPAGAADANRPPGRLSRGPVSVVAAGFSVYSLSTMKMDSWVGSLWGLVKSNPELPSRVAMTSPRGPSSPSLS